ncbi:paralemmin 1a [Hippocampus zosterae]|uniref:paralemmin 1a n=1 Tax=Hippocampus zosterae TaxID=109293 RepID=UPI00223E71B6|nr:paralemmin 1a [Hippocampus zosterae]XP_051930187.1 paralemmin 1a [Hippocampus zosterae]
MKRAVYSVEIKVERDKNTGQTRVLSSHTKLPVDCSRGGVKVYEDEQKVVHEVNGQDGVHLLSAAEVDELIQAADRAATSAEEAAEPPSTRETTTASGDDLGGLRGRDRETSGPRKPLAGAGSARGREAADETEAEGARMAAGPEAAAPPPNFAPTPRTDERESAGAAAETAAEGKKACKCCSVM